jgi:hypothetical protein
MLELSLSSETTERLARLDVAWEQEMLQRLPFPLAYAVNRVRQEEVPWDVLLKDAVNALVRYTALLGVSEYLASGDKPDHDVNDEVMNLARPVSDGDWWKLAKACAHRQAPGRPLAEMAAAILRMEREDALRVSMAWDRYCIRSGPLSPVLTLVHARNRLYAHGVTPTGPEKAQASAQIRQLFRLVLDELAAIWSYDLCVPLPEGKTRQHYLLRGIGGFTKVTPPAGVSADQAYLRLPNGSVLLLHPLTLGEPTEGAVRGSLLDQTAELYLLNQIKLQKTMVPVYLGMAGDQPERRDLSASFDTLLTGKQVWAKRQDVPVERVLQYVAKKSRDSLEYFEWNNLYDPSRHVERPAVEGVVDQFIADDSSRLLFIAGESGSGKTATSIHIARRLLDDNVPVYVGRAVELPTKVGGGVHRLEEWLCALHGYASPFTKILEQATHGPSGRFVIILDGLNEFLSAGRDLEGLWRTINAFVDSHAGRKALKVVVTTRIDGDSLNIYFPHSRVPEFANHGLFRLVDGKPWMVIPSLAPEEIGAMLRAYGMDPQTAATAQQMHGGKLANPNLLSRYAEGVLSGDDLKEVGKDGITKRFVQRRVAKDNELRKNLDRLVATLGKSRALEMTLDQIAKHDPGLAIALTARNNRLLHRMRELGLVILNRGEDEEGQLTQSVALGDDSLFESLWQRRVLMHRVGMYLKSCGSFGILTVALLSLAIVTRNYFPEVAVMRSCPNCLLHRDAQDASPESPSAELQQIQHTATEMIGATRAALANLWCEVWVFAAVNFLALAAWLLSWTFVLTSILNLIELWASPMDARIRYHGFIEYLKVRGLVLRQVLLPAKVLVYGWAAVASAFLVFRTFNDFRQGGLIPTTADAARAFLWVAGPLLAILIVIATLFPPAFSFLQWRHVCASGSHMLGSYWFSRRTVKAQALVAVTSILGFIAMLVPIGIVARTFPTTVAIHVPETRAAILAADQAKHRWIDICRKAVALAGEKDWEGNHSATKTSDLLALTDEPILPEAARKMVLPIVGGLVGLWSVGCILNLIALTFISHKLFPEQWRKRAASSSELP